MRGAKHVDDAHTWFHFGFDEVGVGAAPVDSIGRYSPLTNQNTIISAGLVDGWAKSFDKGASQCVYGPGDTATRTLLQTGSYRLRVIFQHLTVAPGENQLIYTFTPVHVFGVPQDGTPATNIPIQLLTLGNNIRVVWQHGANSAAGTLFLGSTTLVPGQIYVADLVGQPNASTPANRDGALYLNGALELSWTNVTAPDSTGDGWWFLGSTTPTPGGAPFDGVMDEFWGEDIYRTAAEIHADYLLTMAVPAPAMTSPPPPAPPDVPPVVPVVPGQMDHTAAALDRLAMYLKEQPLLAGLLGAVGNRAQALETSLWSFGAEVALETAVGAQLDLLGRVLGFARQGLSDDDYRLWLQARVLLNRSSGTVDELLAIFRLTAAPGTVPLVVEFPPAAFVLRLTGAAQPSSRPTLYSQFLRFAKAGGVRASVEWFECAPSEVFRLDSGPGLDVGHLAGAI